MNNQTEFQFLKLVIVMTIHELLKQWDKKRSILYADEILKINKNLTILNRKKFVKSSLLVGPEGGFSRKKMIRLKLTNMYFISFAETILRIDTAAIVGLSYLKYNKFKLQNKLMNKLENYKWK